MGVLEKGYDVTLGQLNHLYTKLLALFLRRRLELVMGLAAIFAAAMSSVVRVKSAIPASGLANQSISGHLNSSQCAARRAAARRDSASVRLSVL